MYDKLILSLVFLVIFLANASAQSLLTIDLDSSGNANFDNGTTTSNLTSKQGDIWIFSYSSPGNSLEIVLPRSSEILDLSAEHISTKNDRITLFSEDYISVKYKVSAIPKNYTLYIISATAVITLLILFYYYYIRKLKTRVDNVKTKARDKLEIIKKVLNEREKIILNNLRKSGKIKMSHLRKLTGIPKASFSRHLQELERKQLIRRKGEGKNKFVEIK
jgi:uncharacterized membrane protein